MKDFEEILANLRRRMEIVGSWPKSNPSLAYRAFGYFNMCLASITAAGALIQAFNPKDFVNLSQALCFGLVTLMCVLKHIIFFSNKKNFRNVLNILKHLLVASDEVHLKQKLRICNIIRGMCLYCSIVIVVLTNLLPFVELSERLLPFPIPLNLKEQPFFIYIFIWIIQSLVTTIVASNFYCQDMLVFTFLMLAVGQLEILRERIIHSTRICRDNDASIIILLRKCVIHHIAIERYVAAIEQTYRLSFLLQLIIGTILTCFSGFACLILPIASVKFVGITVSLILSMITISIICFPGNEIMFQSENIRHACYMTQWENCGTSVRKSLLIIMERSKRPLMVTAGKFTPMALATLLTMFNSAVSYFTILFQLYSARKSA